jgi:hypothetical protein
MPYTFLEKTVARWEGGLSRIAAARGSRYWLSVFRYVDWSAENLIEPAQHSTWRCAWRRVADSNLCLPACAARIHS